MIHHNYVVICKTVDILLTDKGMIPHPPTLYLPLHLSVQWDCLCPLVSPNSSLTLFLISCKTPNQEFQVIVDEECQYQFIICRKCVSFEVFLIILNHEANVVDMKYDVG